jgi:hypothetical protein
MQEPKQPRTCSTSCRQGLQQKVGQQTDQQDEERVRGWGGRALYQAIEAGSAGGTIAQAATRKASSAYLQGRTHHTSCKHSAANHQAVCHNGSATPGWQHLHAVLQQQRKQGAAMQHMELLAALLWVVLNTPSKVERSSISCMAVPCIPGCGTDHIAPAAAASCLLLTQSCSSWSVCGLQAAHQDSQDGIQAGSLQLLP